MLKSISNFCLPRYDEIANVGLYLDQVVKYINFYLNPLGNTEITASMISNYVKHKIVPAPVKKLYYAEHIASLIFIIILKPVVALDDIKLMFSIQKLNYDLRVTYNYFCDELENLLKCAFGMEAKQFGVTSSDEKDMLYNAICTVVNKIFLDKYIAAFRELAEE